LNHFFDEKNETQMFFFRSPTSEARKYRRYALAGSLHDTIHRMERRFGWTVVFCPFLIYLDFSESKITSEINDLYAKVEMTP